MTTRLLLLPEGDRKPTRDVLSGCSVQDPSSDAEEGAPTPSEFFAPGECRGVEEAVFVPAGYRRFIVVSASGELLQDTLVLARIVEAGGFIAGLRRFLDCEDRPQSPLNLIP